MKEAFLFGKEEKKMEKETVRLVIENCEPQYSEWLELEYKHCAQLWNNILFTNVKAPKLKSKLAELGNAEVREESILELEQKKRIVLDPLAELELKREDFDGAEEIVIGGILGDKEFTGKTKSLISSKLPAETRNLGKKQLSIDTAALVTKLILYGTSLKELELTDELEIQVDPSYSVVLPYGYPVIDGKLIVTPGLVDYLAKS